MATLGSKLHQLIKNSGKTMMEVATALNTTEGNLFKLVKKDEIRMMYLQKASEYFGVPLSYFIDNQQNIVNEDQEPYGKNLIEKIKNQERIIENLRQENQKLKSKLQM